MLTGDGYNVIATANGSEALREVEGQDVTIDIVITDLVMPGMGGSDLSRALADIRPGIKVLFMSGYTADTVLRNGRFEAGTAFLQKPFTKDSLARKVRATLDS
jgi:CheY-like chemotaxis protein